MDRGIDWGICFDDVEDLLLHSVKEWGVGLAEIGSCEGEILDLV